MRRIGFFLLLVCISFAPASVVAQTFDTKALLEDYSRELFETNAAGFMSPLVIVTNVGANDAFYNSAYIPKENKLYFDISLRGMLAFVRDDERTYTGYLPTEASPNPYPPLSDAWNRVFQLNLFKSMLRGAVEAGETESSVVTATVFGGQGSSFTIPKEYIAKNYPFIDSTTLARLPDDMVLTSGTNQQYVGAVVPQLTIGSLYSTELLLRYAPPVVFDPNVGKVMFFGVAVKHAFTNWMDDPPFDAAVQVGYQYTTIRNEVGVTKAKLEANTDLFAVNVHASRRFGWIEPYAGLSYESLNSIGSYTFTLPQNVVDEIGYDIDPQRVDLTLSDEALKATVGLTAHAGPLQIFGAMGIAKHLIFSAGIGYRFETALEIIE